MIGDNIDNGMECKLGDALVVMNRLDPDNWEFKGVDLDLESIPVMDDDDPDKPIIETLATSLRNLNRGSIVLKISYKHGHRHECPCCHKPMQIVKWTKTRYQTSPVLSMKAKLEISVPQLHCKECGGYHKLKCPIVVENHTYTKILAIDVLSMLSTETVSDTSDALGVGSWKVFDILGHTINPAINEQDLSYVNTLYIDEIQSTHGQNYITMVADQNHRAICGFRGHDIDTVRMIREWLYSRGCRPEQIEYVSADMSTAYKAGVKECFPNAKLILDVFHVLKMVSEALDVTRKKVNKMLKAKGQEPLKKIKYTLLRRESNQTEEDKVRMAAVKMHSEELALAFDLKEEFYHFFDKDCDKHQARSKFFSWYNRCQHSRIEEMVDVSRRLLKRLNDILRWFEVPLTNAVAEGLNSVYKRIKAAAYGYANETHLIIMCLFRKGNLTVRI